MCLKRHLDLYLSCLPAINFNLHISVCFSIALSIVLALFLVVEKVVLKYCIGRLACGLGVLQRVQGIVKVCAQSAGIKKVSSSGM